MAQVDDDSDLPELDTPPKDPATGRFVSPKQDPTEQPQHSAYMLSKARAYGVNDAATMSPAELDRLLIHVDRVAAQSGQRPPAPPPAEVEEPLDWGEADGKKLTEADYAAPVREAYKAAHELKKVKKELEAIKAAQEQERNGRNARQAERSLQRKLAEHPELFGEKPGQAAPGSVEARRYQAVVNHLNGLFQSKSQTTLDADVDSLYEMWGLSGDSKPKPKAPRSPVADYEAAELARPTARRGTQPTATPRENRIAALTEQQRENGVYFPPGAGDDDADLPD